jgi:protein gp37
MSDQSHIQWTDATWNTISGCTRVSPGCERCYIDRTPPFRMNGRKFDSPAIGGTTGVVRHEERLTLPLSWRKPRRVFVNSLSDLFHEDVPDEHIARLWQAMSVTPQHTYQILTKRPARMRSWVRRWYSGEIPEPYDVRPIPGYDGYAVTTHGEVLGKRADTRGGMKMDAGEQGHMRVMLYPTGERPGRRELVHRLVLTTFVRPARPGEQACHRNGDPSDNRLSNLYWGTQSDNWRDRLAHGHGRSYQKLTEQQVAEIRKRHAAGQSAYSMAKDYGVSDTQIRNIVLNRQWATARLIKVPTPSPSRVVIENCWLGVSTEDQRWAEMRIPLLLETPAAVRFISAEPLLGPIDLRNLKAGGGALIDALGGDVKTPQGEVYTGTPSVLDWAIIGGESGPNARPMDSLWAMDLVIQCSARSLPMFVKQLGSVWARENGAADRKGGDPAEWPKGLQERHFPRTREAVSL